MMDKPAALFTDRGEKPDRPPGSNDSPGDLWTGPAGPRPRDLAAAPASLWTRRPEAATVLRSAERTLRGQL